MIICITPCMKGWNTLLLKFWIGWKNGWNVCLKPKPAKQFLVTTKFDINSLSAKCTPQHVLIALNRKLHHRYQHAYFVYVLWQLIHKMVAHPDASLGHVFSTIKPFYFIQFIYWCGQAGFINVRYDRLRMRFGQFKQKIYELSHPISVISVVLKLEEFHFSNIQFCFVLLIITLKMIISTNDYFIKMALYDLTWESSKLR